MNRSWILAAAVLAAAGAQAQTISITTLGASTGTDFNTLQNVGTVAIVGGSPINGVYAVRTGTGTNIVADPGTNAGGNNYSYGVIGNADRALGSVGSGNVAAGSFFYGVRFTNNTGSTITSLAVSYVGEQWRNGNNTTPNVVAFSYVTGATVGVTLADFQTAGNNVTALDFTSPINTAAAGSLDGNAAANRVALSANITGLNIPNGNEILLRWSDPDHGGNDHGLGIDDVFVVATGGPACVTNPVVANTNDAGAGSLRQAMLDACNNSTITFNAATFGSAQTITLTSGQLTTPATPVTITGPGAALLTVSGGNTSRVMQFVSQTATLSGMTLSQGNGVGGTSSFGAALRSASSTTSLTDVRIINSVCSGGSAALSNSFGTLNLLRTEVSGNTCNNNSGLYLQDGTTTIRDSLIANNTGTSGDAIRMGAQSQNATLNLINSTITGHATQAGASMALTLEGQAGFTATANIINSTISGNTSTAAGQGAIGVSGLSTKQIILTNTLLVGNTAAGVPSDSSAALDASSSFNVIGAGGGLTNGVNNNQVGVTAAQAALAALGSYGGPTPTMALLPGSVAINAGTATGTPTADQRGIARPAGLYDVGAFESQGFAISAAGGNNQSTRVNTAFGLALSTQVVANQAVEPVAGGQITYVPPGAGASAALTPLVATVNASGVASANAVANGTVGTYSVSAQAAGASGSPTFALQNLPGGTGTTFQFSAATYSVNENGTNATITVTATPAPSAPIAVDYATSNGSATAGADYTASAGTLNFAAGASTQTFMVPITDDGTPEPNETVNLSLSNPTGGATLGTPSTAVLTINDNDAASSLQFSAATYSVSENGASAIITVTATPAPTAAVSVSYATSNGSAVSGSDYTAAAGTLNFGVGVTTQTFAVPITNDATVEANETVNLALSNPTGGATLGTPSTAVLTIVNDDTTSITVSSPNVAEGNAGTTPLAFVVSLSNPVQGAISLDYASADGNNVDPLQNATIADNDYQAATGTVSFPSDSTTPQTINVSVVGDTDVEPNQQLRLALSNLQIPPGMNAASFNLTNASGVGTINNDDGTTLSVNSPTQAEGNVAGQLPFVVTLSSASKTPVTVNYATAGVTATSGTDFTAATGTLTFAPGGPLTQTVNVAIAGENIVEANETLTLTLSNPSGATLGAGTGTGTLNNDDSATLSLDSPNAAEGNAGNSPLTFTATLSAPVQGTVSATLNTADGNNVDPTLNATVADNDYVAVANGTVSIATGLTATTAVQMVGDLEVEPNQGLRLSLSNLQVPAGIPAGAVTLGTATGTGTINNDDSAALSIAANSAVEGNAGTSVLNLTVTLSAPSKTPVTVNYASANGTATAGSDYVAATGTLTFASGVTTQLVPVTINGDTTLEPDETFTVTLSAPVGATLGTATATGTISNDDMATLSVADASAPEGSSNQSPGQLRFTVTLSGTAAVPVTVNYATAGVSATSGVDFTAATGTLTFPAGSTSQVITVTLVPDMLNEPDETLTLTLSNPLPAALVSLGRATATGTITNDDFVSQIPALGTRGLWVLLLLFGGLGLMATARRQR